MPPMPQPTSRTREPADRLADSASRATWLSWAWALVSVGEVKRPWWMCSPLWWGEGTGAVLVGVRLRCGCGGQELCVPYFEELV